MLPQSCGDNIATQIIPFVNSPAPSNWLSFVWVKGFPSMPMGSFLSRCLLPRHTMVTSKYLWSASCTVFLIGFDEIRLGTLY